MLHDRQGGEEGGEAWRVKGDDLKKKERGDALGRIARGEHNTSQTHPPPPHHLPSPTSPTKPNKPTSPPPSSPPSSPPYTYHPLLHPRLPPTTRTLLLTALDLLILLTLAGYTVLYFSSLKTAQKFCNSPLLSDEKVPHSERNVALSQRDLCAGLNVDIHVAGGFAVFMAFGLGVCHLAALGVRGGEGVGFGRGDGGVVGQVAAERGGCAGVGDGKRESACSAPKSSLPSTTVYPRHSLEAGDKQSTDRPREAISLGKEERGTGVGFVDRSAAKNVRRSAKYMDESGDTDTTTVEKRWTEALLECLLP